MQDEGTNEAGKPKVMNLHHKDITTSSTYTHNTVTYGVRMQMTFIRYNGEICSPLDLSLLSSAHHESLTLQNKQGPSFCILLIQNCYHINT